MNLLKGSSRRVMRPTGLVTDQTLTARTGAAPIDINIVGLVLAGLVDEEDAARDLGLDDGDLQSLLRELNLDQTAMVPVTVDNELATWYADIGRSEFDVSLFDSVIESEPLTNPTKTTIGFRLSADAVLEATAMSAGRAPDGLIFHVGRCGSTLLCNLLVSAGGWVALMEPEFLNTLWRRLAKEKDGAGKERLSVLTAQLIRSLTHGVRFDAKGRERSCVVKLSSWNAMLVEDLVTRFEETPLVCVTRDPCETVASFLHNPPYWYEARSVGGDRLQAIQFFAEVWNQIVAAALRFPAPRMLFIDYGDLVADPSATVVSLCGHLGDQDARPDSKAVAEVMAHYSKGARGERFETKGRHRPHNLKESERDMVESITASGQTALRERMAGESSGQHG